MRAADKLVFAAQLTPLLQRDKLYHSINHLDQLFEKSERIKNYEAIVANTPVISRATMVFGQWICNFSCPQFCYTKTAYSKTIPLQQMKRYINAVVTLGATHTYWPGAGEVTLLKDFWDLAEFHKTLKLPMIVFTNGSVFIDDAFAKRHTGVSSSVLLKKVRENPYLYFYVKFWAGDPSVAAHLVGTSSYPYDVLNGLPVPSAFIALQREAGTRIGFQTMVRQSNFSEFTETIYPWCERNEVNIFVEPIIFTGSAANSAYASSEILDPHQADVLNHVFASGGNACFRRQFGELILIGDRLSPGIAINPRSEDRLFDSNDVKESVLRIYFSNYFREMRREADRNGGCLCRDLANQQGPRAGSFARN